MKTNPFVPKRFNYTLTRSIRLPYLLREPDGHDGVTQAPLILFLHGAGEKGDDLDKLQKSGHIQAIEQALSFPAWVLCPQCPAGLSGWPIQDVTVLLDQMLTELPIDPRRVYVTGISMGGRGTYEFAYDYGDRAAAIVPLCAFGIPTLSPRLRELPVWAFHGALDDIVPVQRGFEMTDALRQAGANVQFTRLQDQGHDIGIHVYRDPALWDWLARQQRMI